MKRFQNVKGKFQQEREALAASGSMGRSSGGSNTCEYRGDSEEEY